MGDSPQQVPTVPELVAGWREQGIRNVRFELPDMHGTSRIEDHPDRACRVVRGEGLNMYGGHRRARQSRSDVVAGTLYHEEIGYGDQLLAPDPETAAIVPWAEATARLICDAHLGRRPPSRGRAAPRVPARRSSAATSSGSSRALGSSPSSISSTGTAAALRRLPHLQHGPEHLRARRSTEIVDEMAEFGIDIITANCEYAGSQWEINFSPGAGMDGPDDAFTFKNGVKELAHARACSRRSCRSRSPTAPAAAPQPHGPVDLDSGENASATTRTASGASPSSAAAFIAGQLRHARSIYALLAPTVNCLKRRRTHTFSPTNVSWGIEDRSALSAHQGRLAEEPPYREPRPDGAVEPVPRRRGRCSAPG